MAPRNLAELFQNTVGKFHSKKAFLYKDNNRYRSFSYGESLKKVRAIASALILRGALPGDRLAILSENRPEWALVDLACQSIGVITVPIYTSLAPPEIQYILKDSGAKYIAVSNKALFEKISSIQKSCEFLQGILAMDAAVLIKQEGFALPIWRQSDLEKTQPHPDLTSRFEAILGEDVSSIIYTSGTTGFPKGVMLTHRNFIDNVLRCHEAFPMSEQDLHLSFLPLCHVFERTVGYYLMIYIGASIAYAETMDSVPQNMLEVRPTFLLGVPRFYEKIQTRVLDALKTASGFRKNLYAAAVALGQKRRSKDSALTLRDRFTLRLLRVLVFKKFRGRLGGRIRFCVSGGAALSKDIGEFFHNLGLTICEGYGLTETSPVISANRVGHFKFGSIGRPLKDIQVNISEEGEIITQSTCVMKGYYRKPEETAAVLKNGWFCTGDLGYRDSEGFLFITGRKKDILVTSGGKKISPRPIEELLEKDPYILRAVLCGEGKKYIVALLIPRKEKLIEYAEDRKISFLDYAGLLKAPRIYQFLDERVQNLMKDFASYERIKYFALLESDFTQESGELTPTLKVKRTMIFSRYHQQIESLYTPEKTSEHS